MLTSLSVVSQPAAEPVSMELLRMHCRIDHSSDDLLLESYLASARTMAESYLSRALITQTLLWTMMPESELRPNWHYICRPLQLPRAPVQSITSVTVLDTLGNSTTIPVATLPIVPAAAFTGYIADLVVAPQQLTIGRNTVLTDGHTLRQSMIRHVQVQFVAGYGADFKSVPKPIINSILLTTAFLYEHRGDGSADMPQAAQWLLDPHRLQFLGG